MSSLISLIKEIDNSLIKKLVQISEGTTDTVDNEYYSSTVFGTYKEYKSSMEVYENVLIGSTIKKVWNSVLIFEKGNDRKLYSCSENKGIAFGWVMIDYRTRVPLVCIVVDKDGSKYSYNSVTYDAKSKAYISSVSDSIKPKDTKTLLDFISASFNKDLDKFPDQ